MFVSWEDNWDVTIEYRNGIIGSIPLRHCVVAYIKIDKVLINIIGPNSATWNIPIKKLQLLIQYQVFNALKN